MRPSRTGPRRVPLAAYCAGVVLAAGACAAATLLPILAIPCDRSLDPQRFCVWWAHSAAPTLAGVPGVLALACYASMTRHSRRPVTVAGVLVALVCLGLRAAAAPDFY